MHKRSFRAALTAAAFLLPVLAAPPAPQAGIFPPWQHGENNDATKGTPRQQAAKLWLAFIHSPQALSIFESYGFKPYTGTAPTN